VSPTRAGRKRAPGLWLLTREAPEAEMATSAQRRSARAKRARGDPGGRDAAAHTLLRDQRIIYGIGRGGERDMANGEAVPCPGPGDCPRAWSPELDAAIDSEAQERTSSLRERRR